MSSNLEDEAEQLVRLKLKLGINRSVSNSRGQQYIGQLEYIFRHAAKDVFDSVVEEMIQEGLLLRVEGRNKGVLLRRSTPPMPAGGLSEVAREA